MFVEFVFIHAICVCPFHPLALQHSDLWYVACKHYCETQERGEGMVVDGEPRERGGGRERETGRENREIEEEAQKHT